MRLESSLKRWLSAGLLTPETAEAITAFEAQRRKGTLARNIMVVALCAIGLGLLALVAANWQIIPAGAKIIIHFFINAIVAGFMLRIDPAHKPLARDALVGLLSVLFLTLIALIGQVFQLHGDVLPTLNLWFAIVTPLVFVYGRGILIAGPYALGLAGLLLFNLQEYYDLSASILSLGYLLIPLLLGALGLFKPFQQAKPHFAKAFVKLAVGLLVINAFAFTLGFYKPSWSYDLVLHRQITIMVLGGMLLVCAAWTKADPYIRLFVGLSLFVPFLSFAFYGAGGFVVATFVFVVYGLAIASLAVRMGFEKQSETIIYLILLRLFVFYCELFGNLLVNGLGLIITGLLLIMVVRNFAHIQTFMQKLLKVRLV